MHMIVMFDPSIRVVSLYELLISRLRFAQFVIVVGSGHIAGMEQELFLSLHMWTASQIVPENLQ